MNPFASLAARHQAEEQMDAADLADRDYAAVLRDLARVNVATMAARPTLRFLDTVLERHRSARPWRILDVGFGDGGMLRAIARWVAKTGQPVALTGIDLNPRSERVARAETSTNMKIDWRTGDYAALAGGGWNIVLSSLVTHHMSDAERQDFLRFMEREAALGWMINDLHRHRIAYLGYPLLAAAMRVHPIVRADGQLSVARSFRPPEWHAMLAQAGLEQCASIVRYFPYRLCVERIV